MSTEYHRGRNEHGEPVLTITVTGAHDIFRLSWNMLNAQCEFFAGARDTYQWLRRVMGAKRFDTLDQMLTGGKVRGYSIRRRERL